MSDELRAAAYRLLGYWYDSYRCTEEGLSRECLEDIYDVCKAVVGEADDAEPVTMEWWMSLGARPLREGDKTLYVTKDAGYDCHEIGLGTSNCVGWLIADTFPRDSVAMTESMIGDLPGSRSGGVATRGAVRRLLTALGIPITPTPRG